MIDARIDNGPVKSPGSGVFSLCARWLKSRSGATAVEFAMIAPLLFSLLVGTVEIGRFFYVRSSLQKAVDDASRHAMRISGASDQQLLQIAQQNLISSVSVKSQFQFLRATVSGTTFLTVVVDYDFEPVANIVPFGDIQVNLQSRVPLIN